MTVYRLLVVDNQRDTRKFLRQSLAALGQDFRISEAASGEEALLMLRSEQIDLLVSDLRLAGMTGLELVQKSRLQRPDIKTILLAARPDDRIRQQAAAQGVSSLLEKPLDTAAYLQSVGRCLGLDGEISPVAPQPELITTAEDHEAPDIAVHLAALRTELGARTVALMDESGQAVAQTGEPLESLLSAAQIVPVMAAWSAGVNLSLALENGVPRGIYLFPGRSQDIYLSPVGISLVLLALCPAQSTSQLCSRAAIQLPEAADQILHMLTSLGVPLSPDLPQTGELPAVVDGEDEVGPPDPVMEALFSQLGEQPQLEADANSYWEELPQGFGQQTGGTGSLTYDQAQRLGLAPDEGLAAAIPD